MINNGIHCGEKTFRPSKGIRHSRFASGSDEETSVTKIDLRSFVAGLFGRECVTSASQRRYGHFEG
jgi:hypothetical protein